MNEIQKIETALTETIKDEEFQSVTTDLAEVILDSVLTEGVLKEIPGFSSIIGLVKTANNVRDKMLIEKLIYFLTQFKDVPKEKRKKMIEEIDISRKYKIKVGKKLLFILEKCQDTEKSEICGKLFRAFLNQEITYDDFLRVFESIEMVFIPDLLEFVDERWEETSSNDSISSLATAGIIRIGGIKPLENSIEGITDSDMIYVITEIGIKLRKLLSTKPFPTVTSLF